MDIMQWLAESIRNRHWFGQAHTPAAVSAYIAGFDDAYGRLRDELGDRRPWTREEYLEWSGRWKATYSLLSSDSRTSKESRKASVVGYDASLENIVRIRTLRRQAGWFLDLRKGSREKAERSYRAERLVGA